VGLSTVHGYFAQDQKNAYKTVKM